MGKWLISHVEMSQGKTNRITNGVTNDTKETTTANVNTINFNETINNTNGTNANVITTCKKRERKC